MNPWSGPRRCEPRQLDFKAASSVPADPHGKKQQVVETLKIIDKGTSVWVAHHVRSDFSAQTALAAVAQPFGSTWITYLHHIGSGPAALVGARPRRDFPAALVRFCHALGVAVVLSDPYHPQPNGFVERYHRTRHQECLKRERPKTLDEVRQVTEAFAAHYNWHRPHQGVSCGNRPPRVAFPHLPSLPPLPDVVHPDAWGKLR